jgi:cytochrome c peroxidase
MRSISRQERQAVTAILAAVAVLWASTGFRADEPRSDAAPRLAPLPAEVPAPDDNPTTAERVELGKQLFFDPRLSGDNTMSCATCHDPGKAFGDGLERAKGHGGKTLERNTPGLLNAGLYSTYLWDGRANSLEEQALTPIQSPAEMNQDLEELERELNAVPGYVEQFRAIFGSGVTRDGVARALAAFQRTLVSRNSPLDRYLAGDEDALSAEAKAGMRLFLEDAGCARCHHGPLLSDSEFYRLGIDFRDAGRGAITGKTEDRFKFRTPSLRDVAHTGPYMHDGSRKTLHDVVEFYYRAVPPVGPEGLPLDIEPLSGRSFSEIDAIVAFLEALSGEPPEIEPPALP